MISWGKGRRLRALSVSTVHTFSQSEADAVGLTLCIPSVNVGSSTSKRVYNPHLIGEQRAIVQFGFGLDSIL